MSSKPTQATYDPSTSSAAGSPVRTSVAQARAQASPSEHVADSGSSSVASSPSCARGSSSSKTSRAGQSVGCPRCGATCTCLDTTPAPTRFLPPTSGPHLRRRIFVVAHPVGESLRILAERMPGRRSYGVQGQGEAESIRDGSEKRLATHGNADRDGESAMPVNGQAPGLCSVAGGSWSRTSASVLRGMDDGLSDRVDPTSRLKALGNAVVNQCAEVIGRIVKAQAWPDPLEGFL